MKLAIFGASGRTGKILIEQALSAGHQVVAVVRDIAKITPAQNLEIRSVDISNLEETTKVLEGVEVVFNCLGSNHLGKTDLQEKSIQVILKAMSANGIKRIIVLGASGSLHPSLKHASFGRKIFFWIIRNTFLKHPMRDSGNQQRILEGSSADYTVVLPPRLTDGPYVGKYRVDAEGLPPQGQLLGRADLAEFMLRQASDPQWIRQCPYVAY